MFYAKLDSLLSDFAVAPLAGAWVEMPQSCSDSNTPPRRSPRGGVG